MIQGLFLSSELLKQATHFSVGVSPNNVCPLAVFPQEGSIVNILNYSESLPVALGSHTQKVTGVYIWAT